MLRSQGTRLIALRSAGFNNVDLDAADALDLVVVRVPAYSPYAVAEHTVGLVLALNRKLPRAHNRVREGNFALEGCSVSTSMARPPASSVPAKSGQSWRGS
jgi:D-lactate dehydrogenase